MLKTSFLSDWVLSESGAIEELRGVAALALTHSSGERVDALVSHAKGDLVQHGCGFERQSVERAIEKIQKSALLTNERDERYLLDFSNRGAVHKEADLSAFEVIWIDQFNKHETFSVSAAALAEFCASQGVDPPTELELEAVQKALPRPFFDWPRRAYKLIEEKRLENARFTW